jgi:probable rRNA maturation factor
VSSGAGAGLEIEVTVAEGLESPDREAVRLAAEMALRAAGVTEGHLAVAFVGRSRIRGLNRSYRGGDSATDVLSFPIDRGQVTRGPRELGDVVVCAELSDDPIAAVVHGVLHLAGHDHETDDGRMLALQERVVAELR